MLLFRPSLRALRPVLYAALLLPPLLAVGAGGCQSAPAARGIAALDAPEGSAATSSSASSLPGETTTPPVIADARKLLAEERPREARRILDAWIEENDYIAPRPAALPRAYLLRGDAILALGDEFQALYDYEELIREFPGSPEYAIAVERELEIGIRYLHGLRRRFPQGWGPRFGGATDVGEELLVRVQERMPGSDLAERAAIELADFYYRNRNLAAASDAYEVFIVNHPNSEHIRRAHQRRIYANIARFKGPSYDASGLKEAQVLIDDYAAIDPLGAERDGLTDALTARLEESVAAQQLEKAQWYLQRSDPVAARFMLRRLVRTHPRTVSADVALQMLETRGWSLAEEQ